MKKSKRKSNLIFQPIKSPYKIEGDNNSVENYYQRYMSDEEAIMEIDGLIYYKIIDLSEFRIRKACAIVTVDSKMGLKIDDKLIDENGNIYHVKGFEMFRISATVFPEWYLKVCFVLIDGDPYKMGDYLAKLQ